MNNLMRKILLRRSVYNFSENLLREEDLMAILEEGKQLSNAANNQAWHFTAVQNKSVIQKVVDLSLKKSVQYGRLKAVNGSSHSVATKMNLLPTVLVVSGSGDIRYSEDAANTLFGSMMLAADNYGIKSGWISTRSEIDDDDAEEIRELLQIPREYMPLCLGAFGYREDDGDIKITYIDDVVNIIR